MRRWRFLSIVAAGLLGSALPALGQDYPNRPITLVVPFPPGGSTTIMARIIADAMSQALGQQIIVDNRAGAGGTLGSKSVAHAAPDGYTLLLGYNGALAIGPSLYANVGYDPRKDFTYIGMIGSAPSTLLVHPSVPAKTVAELIKVIKESPTPLLFGSPGVGTVNHLAAELFAFEAKVKMTHVPYKGSGPAMNDLLGGHIPLMFTPVPVAHGNAAAGKLRALGVTSLRRSSLMPDVPTIAESGLPGFEVALHYGLAGPAGMPRAIVERLNQVLNAALATEEVKKRLATEGAEPSPGTPEDYWADTDREEAKWSKLVKAIGLKAP